MLVYRSVMSDYWVEEPLICQSQYVKFRAFCRYMLQHCDMRGNLLAGEDIDRISLTKQLHSLGSHPTQVTVTTSMITFFSRESQANPSFATGILGVGIDPMHSLKCQMPPLHFNILKLVCT